MLENKLFSESVQLFALCKEMKRILQCNSILGSVVKTILLLFIEQKGFYLYFRWHNK